MTVSRGQLNTKREKAAKAMRGAGLMAPAGVAEAQYRRTVERMRRDDKAVLDASAFQSELALKYRLPGAQLVAKRTAVRRPDAKGQSNGAKATARGGSNGGSGAGDMSWVCACCGHSNASKPNGNGHGNGGGSGGCCEICGYFSSGAVARQVESLAQRRGLVAGPAPVAAVLRPAEWTELEARVAARQDAHCPICMNGFAQGMEVLLSCSHVFHQACLQAFETFMKAEDRHCPICRATHYQKKLTQQGSQAYRTVCARKIQAQWRGYAARRRFHRGLKARYQRGQGPVGLRKKFYERELSLCADQMVKQVETREGELDSMFGSLDQALEEGKKLDSLFDEVLLQRQLLSSFATASGGGGGGSSGGGNGGIAGIESLSARLQALPLLDADMQYVLRSGGEEEEKARENLRWKEIAKKALRRGLGDCAICMCSNLAQPTRALSLLSCAHVFHQVCIENCEHFIHRKQRLCCPVCRTADYERRALPADELRSLQAEANMLEAVFK